MNKSLTGRYYAEMDTTKRAHYFTKEEEIRVDWMMNKLFNAGVTYKNYMPDEIEEPQDPNYASEKNSLYLRIGTVAEIIACDEADQELGETFVI